MTAIFQVYHKYKLKHNKSFCCNIILLQHLSLDGKKYTCKCNTVFESITYSDSPFNLIINTLILASLKFLSAVHTS